MKLKPALTYEEQIYNLIYVHNLTITKTDTAISILKLESSFRIIEFHFLFYKHLFNKTITCQICLSMDAILYFTVGIHFYFSTLFYDYVCNY